MSPTVTDPRRERSLTTAPPQAPGEWPTPPVSRPPALRRPRPPARAGGEFLAAATAGFSAFSLPGLFAALAPTSSAP
jgi:hypothetical protein